MPARYSNKRAKLVAYADALAKTNSLAVARTPNSDERAAFRDDEHPKVFDLPLELLMEIISHFKYLPSPLSAGTMITPGFKYSHLVPEQYLERTDILRALSQTCKRWRNLFFHLLWERLDTCATHNPSGAWYQVFGEAVIRKSVFVDENPDLAALVRSMSVSISRYSVGTVLPAFIRTIEALPNMHTLQLIKVHHKMTTVLKTTFDGHIFPQVKTIVLPTYAHNILRCCPNVRTVICNDYAEASKLVSAIAKSCRKVEEIEGFWGDERLITRLVKAAPGLRSIKFSVVMKPTCIQILSSLKKLSQITLHSNTRDIFDAVKDPLNLSCVKSARTMLQRSEVLVAGRKSITLEYRQWDYLLGEIEEWSKTIGIYESL